ncbi:MAG: hypothetical protein PWP23_2499 [Candidatus Sumerlaeota bacterium]|nr:hypothetical protein [Candidatus Sumerlaeota bacterium]
MKHRDHLSLAFWLALLVALLVLVSGPVRAQTLIEEPEDKFQVVLLGDQEQQAARPGPLKIVGTGENDALSAHLEDVAFQARGRLRSATRVDWQGTAFIVWVENERDYRQFTGMSPEFTAAAASAERRTVWINAAAWKKSDPQTQLHVMTHELGHLLVGNLPGGRDLPLWAEEGLVMHLAGEWGLEQSLAVSRAHALGQLPALEQLESRFPTDPEMQSLAYGVGYLAVREIAGSLGDGPGAPARLMRRLADETAGPRMSGNLWDPTIRDGWDLRMRESLGGRFTHLMILISSGATLWVLIMALAFWAWAKKRARRRAADQKEEEEEAWAASLTEDDVREVWGAKEDEQEAKAEEDEYPWERWERLKEEEE